MSVKPYIIKSNLGVGTSTVPAGAGLVVASGNVGIGTSNPTAKLHIQGIQLNSGPIGIGTSSTAGLTDNTPLTIFGNVNVVSEAGAFLVNGVAISAVTPGGTSSSIQYNSSGTFTGDSSKFSIVPSTGNVGIGTVIPQSKFEVYGGNVKIGSDTYGLVFADGTFQSTASISTPPGGTNRAIQYNNNGSFGGDVNQLSIDTNGNVGIGTSSPSSQLTVYGGNIKIDTGSSNYGIIFSDGTFLKTASTQNSYTSNYYSYTGNGVTTEYSTGSSTATDKSNTMVYINGVYQRKTTYTWSDTTITFNSAPVIGAVIEINVVAATTTELVSPLTDLTLTGSTPSTSSTNGTLLLQSGGAGIAGNINVGGAVNTFTGNVGIGTSTSAGLLGSNVLTVFGNVNIVSPNGAFLVNGVASVGGGVTTFSAGTTGFTPSTATSGAITLSGTLATANGGTGLTSGTSGGVLYFSASGTLASSAALAASSLVIGGGAGVAPSTTTTGTGVITALGNAVNTNGGAVVPTTALAQYSLVVGGGSGTGPSVIATGTANQLLTSGGASANPTWTTATYPSTATSTGTILRANGTNWIASTNTFPDTAAAGTFLVAATANTISASPTPTLGVGGTTAGTLALSGLTSGTVTLKTAAAAGNATFQFPSTNGSSGNVLLTDGAGVTSWGSLGTASGGTGLSGATPFTANGLLYASSTSALTTTAQGAANTILTANAGAPSFSATPTIGTSVTVPIVYGGAAAGSSLTLQSTSAAGTTDSILFKVGNNGATTAINIATNGNVMVQTATASTTAATGALTVSGGVGIAGNINVGGNHLNTGNVGVGTSAVAGITAGNVLAVFGNSQYTGIKYLTSTTSSTSTTTGVLVASGGVGVAGNLNAGGSQSLFTGNVGIGTSTPAGLLGSNVLTVFGNINIVSPNGSFLVNGVAFSGGSGTPGGTTGAVQYNSSGTFGGDASNFYYDSTNYRLGIGTGAIPSGSKVYISGGNLKIGEGSNNVGILFSDGTYQTTASTTSAASQTNYSSNVYAYTGDGVTTAFSTSPDSVTDIKNTFVYVSGVYQRKSTYTWTSTTITFSSAPPEESIIEIIVVTAGTSLTGTLVGTTDTQTLTNKRITPRVSSTSSIASPLAWTSDSYDQYCATAQAGDLTISADAGTPTDGQKMLFRFKDSGSTRNLTWTTGSSKSFRAIGVTLPIATTANKTVYVGCVYNAADSRWDAVAVATEA